MQKRFWQLYILCILYLPVHAQQWTFTSYTPKDGLTDARVQKIFQDSKGVLYFLTREGFCSFDGQRFQNYTQYLNQPLSIVNDIVEMKNGRLLVSCISGLYWLENNYLTKDTIHFKHIKEPGALFTARDKVIILSGSGTYLYTNETTIPFTNTQTTNSPKNLIPDKGMLYNNLFIGSQSISETNQTELIIYDWEQQQLVTAIKEDYPIELYSFPQFYCLKENKMWKILDTTALRNGKVTLLPFPIDLQKKGKILYHDIKNNLWFQKSDSSICTYNIITQKTSCYTRENNLPKGINNMFQDRELNYWFIVHGKGVYKLIQSPVEPLTPAGTVQSLNQQNDGSIYLKENNKVVMLQNGKIQEFPIRSKEGTLHIVKRNNHWLTIMQNGMVVNEHGKELYNFTNQYSKKLLSNHLSFDQQNRMLIAGEILSVFTGDSLTSSIALPYFTDNIVVDQQNKYWCFARNGVIQQYQLIGNKIVPQLSYTDNSFSARFSICWNADTFCIGTRSNGIVFVKVNKNQYKKLFTINSNAGLSNNFITGLIKINETRLLTATVVGLDMLHLFPSDTTADQLFSRTGLFTGVTQMVRNEDSSAIAITDDGAAYRINLFSGIRDNKIMNSYFNRILVNGVVIDPIKQHSFSYHQNSFQFSVSAPSFIDEKNIRFIFKLVGNGKEYVQNSTIGDFDIRELPSGNYDLTVTILIPGSSSSSNKIQYTFKIQKPFWKKTLVQIGFIILLGMILYSVFRMILKRKLERQKIEMEKQEAIAKERTRIATDMHDDLGAGISTIKYLSQSAPFISSEIQKENNEKISHQADQLVDKMNDIIWAMNETNDTLDNLIYYTKSWVANFAEQYGLHTGFSLPSVVPPMVIRGEKRQHIFLIVKEAVHNIVKHAEAKKIQLNVEIKDKYLTIRIKDDGIGFDLHKKRSGNGLANMQKRISMIAGKMEIENKDGTEIRCTIPL